MCSGKHWYRTVMMSALIALRIEGSNTFAFQRRDANTRSYPDMLTFFGGRMRTHEDPRTTALRELLEETSIIAKKEDLTYLVSADLPMIVGSREVHLFGLNIPEHPFAVFEGRGEERYTLDEIKSRQDLAPVARCLLDFNLPFFRQRPLATLLQYGHRVP